MLDWTPASLVLLVVFSSACATGNSAATRTQFARDGRSREEVAASVKSATGETLFSLETAARKASVQQQWVGDASYYSDRLVGNLMASGKRYEAERPYAAHRTLPFGSLIRVVRISTGATVVLRVMDRGPFGNRSRIVDVSRAAAERLDLLGVGVAAVRVELLSEPL